MTCHCWACWAFFQLALPCLLVVQLARVLPAPEISLIGLLEVVFGVALVWLGAGEAPGPSALLGGTVVIAALLGNEWLALRERQALKPALQARQTPRESSPPQPAAPA